MNEVEDTAESYLLVGTLRNFNSIFILDYWGLIHRFSHEGFKHMILGHNLCRFLYSSSVVCASSLESNSSKWLVLKTCPLQPTLAFSCSVFSSSVVILLVFISLSLNDLLTLLFVDLLVEGIIRFSQWKMRISFFFNLYMLLLPSRLLPVYLLFFLLSLQCG